MTLPAPETLELEREKLYLTDAELIRRLGVPVRRGRVAIAAWEKDPAFPRKDQFLSGRRYWPAVRAFLDRRNRVTVEPPADYRAVAQTLANLRGRR